jgi:hypothetical protein
MTTIETYGQTDLLDVFDGNTAPRGSRTAKHRARVYFHIDQPGTFLAAHADSELRGINGVVDTTMNVAYGRTYPATRSLTDSFELGSALVVAETADELDRACAQVNRTVNGWFEYQPRYARQWSRATAA